MLTRQLTSVFLILLMCSTASSVLAQGGKGRGFRGGRGVQGPDHGRGQGQAHARDHEVFRFLLTNHMKIKRTVKELPNGVDTLTESDDPQIAAKIQEHVGRMKSRVEKNEPIRLRDPLFAELFNHTDKIKMEYQKTEKGVRVIETSEAPYVAKLIKAHAKAVSGFVKHGFREAMKNHSVPRQNKLSKNDQVQYHNPVIKDYGKVIKLPDAVQQPRKGSKLCVDLTRGGDAGQLNPALEKVARYVNIYQGAGKMSVKPQIALVLHGDATLAVLNDDVYAKRFGTESNPNLKCLHELHEAGVEIYVCGQSLIGKGGKQEDLVVFSQMAVSALTAIVNL
ncbi:MAG: DsrE family protein, partial [Gimesia sp.]|nr:DsrE family protein [Gimesia sp.]